MKHVIQVRFKGDRQLVPHYANTKANDKITVQYQFNSFNFLVLIPFDLKGISSIGVTVFILTVNQINDKKR